MRLKIVLDTNAIISALGRKSPYKIVINQLIANKYDIFITTSYYRFLLIAQDADDDKFADCAIAQSTHFLVTDDRHYRVLINLGFPKVNLLKIKDFSELLESL